MSDDKVRIDRSEALGRAISAMLLTEDVALDSRVAAVYVSTAQAWIAIAQTFREGEGWTADRARIEQAKARAAQGRR